MGIFARIVRGDGGEKKTTKSLKIERLGEVQANGPVERQLSSEPGRLCFGTEYEKVRGDRKSVV